MLYKSKLLTLEPCEIYIFGWDVFMMSRFIGPKWPFLLIYMSYDVVETGLYFG